MNTVNVIEISGDDGLITSLRAFPDTKDGNADAETLFRQICDESTDYSAGDITVAIYNGFCDVPGGASVQLVHSSE
jgi:hypothetical protein